MEQLRNRPNEETERMLQEVARVVEESMQRVAAMDLDSDHKSEAESAITAWEKEKKHDISDNDGTFQSQLSGEIHDKKQGIINDAKDCGKLLSDAKRDIIDARDTISRLEEEDTATANPVGGEALDKLLDAEEGLTRTKEEAITKATDFIHNHYELSERHTDFDIIDKPKLENDLGKIQERSRKAKAEREQTRKRLETEHGHFTDLLTQIE